MAGIVLNIDAVFFKNTSWKSQRSIRWQVVDPKTNAVIAEDAGLKVGTEVVVMIGVVVCTNLHVFKQTVAKDKGAAGRGKQAGFPTGEGAVFQINSGTGQQTYIIASGKTNITNIGRGGRMGLDGNCLLKGGLLAAVR